VNRNSDIDSFVDVANQPASSRRATVFDSFKSFLMAVAHDPWRPGLATM
jgi:hypothetical protein